MNFREINALVPLVTLLIVMSGLLMIHSCEKETKTEKIFEPITIVKPDSVVAKYNQKDGMPLEIKFVTDRPIVYAQALYSIDSTNSGQFNLAGSDTVFVLFDSIPNNNKKTYTGAFTKDSIKIGHKVRIKISMQALGNSGVPASTHYFEKFMRLDVIK